MSPLQTWAAHMDWSALSAWLKQAIRPDVLPIAIGAGLLLAVLGVSFLCIARGSQMGRASLAENKALEEKFAAALEETRARLDSVSGELAELRRSASQVPNAPRSGFNLSKRSQAIRMYRHGEAPDRIAAALEVSPQEIDLLLKVHRIVIKNL
jgi:hypothetical protein